MRLATHPARPTYLLAIFCAVFVTSAAHAEIILSVPPTTIFSSPTSVTTAYFDLTIQATGPLEKLAAYNVGLGITPAAAGVEFTGAAEASSAIFVGQTPMVFGTGSILQAADNLPMNEEASVLDGAGLLRVLIEVAAGATGDFTISFNPDETFFFALDASEIPLTLAGGSIAVRLVPEPTALALGLAGAVAMAVLIRRPRSVPSPHTILAGMTERN